MTAPQPSAPSQELSYWKWEAAATITSLSMLYTHTPVLHLPLLSTCFSCTTFLLHISAMPYILTHISSPLLIYSLIHSFIYLLTFPVWEMFTFSFIVSFIITCPIAPIRWSLLYRVHSLNKQLVYKYTRCWSILQLKYPLGYYCSW